MTFYDTQPLDDLALSRDVHHRKTITATALTLFIVQFISNLSVFSGIDCSFPFSTCYHSWLEKPLSLSCIFLGIILLYVLIGPKRNNKLLVQFTGYTCLLITATGIITYAIYHSTYTNLPMKQVWMNAEPVIPFHVSMGNLMIYNFIFLNAMLLLMRQLKLWIRILSLVCDLSGLLF